MFAVQTISKIVSLVLGVTNFSPSLNTILIVPTSSIFWWDSESVHTIWFDIDMIKEFYFYIFYIFCKKVILKEINSFEKNKGKDFGRSRWTTDNTTSAETSWITWGQLDLPIWMNFWKILFTFWLVNVSCA